MSRSEIRNAEVSIFEMDGRWRIGLKYDEGKEVYISQAKYDSVIEAETAALQWDIEYTVLEERI